MIEMREMREIKMMVMVIVVVDDEQIDSFVAIEDELVVGVGVVILSS